MVRRGGPAGTAGRRGGHRGPHAGLRPLDAAVASAPAATLGGCAAAAPTGLPPVRLVQAGQLYFVVDGHHRVSVARANGSPTVDALVRRVCTVAWACRCVSLLDLPVKAAERQFLERYPLPADARPWLWLDDAADWARVEADARAWTGGTRDGGTDDGGTDDGGTGDGGTGDGDAAAERAASWWEREVVPSAHRCRGTADGPAELRDHLCALRLRDARGVAAPDVLRRRRRDPVGRLYIRTRRGTDLQKEAPAMAYVFLVGAILAEVAGTSLLHRTDGFSRLAPTAATLSAYAVAFALLAQAVRVLPVGVAYAMWSGLGTATIVGVGAVFLGEPLTAAKVVGCRPRRGGRRRAQPRWGRHESHRPRGA